MILQSETFGQNHARDYTVMVILSRLQAFISLYVALAMKLISLGWSMQSTSF